MPAVTNTPYSYICSYGYAETLHDWNDSQVCKDECCINRVPDNNDRATMALDNYISFRIMVAPRLSMYRMLFWLICSLTLTMFHLLHTEALSGLSVDAAAVWCGWVICL